MTNPRSVSKFVPEPFAGHAVSAPPILMASTNTTDFVSGKCETVLMHAEDGQAHSMFIHCAKCGAYNTTGE